MNGSRKGLALVMGLGFSGLAVEEELGFVFIFADEANPNPVAHPLGYTAAGGVLNITDGIDPTSVNALSMV